MADRNVVFEIIGRDRASRTLKDVGDNADKLTHKLRNIDYLGLSAVRAGALALGPALLPVMAAGAAAALGLGTALVSSGAAVGVFGAVTKSAFTEVKTASDKSADLRDKVALLKREAAISGDSVLSAKYMKQAARAQIEYNARLSLLPPATQKVVRAYDGMKTSWQGFVEKNKPAVYAVMTRGFDTVGRHVHDLQPLFDTGAKFAGKWVGSISSWVDGGSLSKVVAFLTANANPALDRLTTIFTNLAGVAGDLAGAAVFSPSGGLLGLLVRGSTALKGWADGGGFLRLMDWLDKNGPGVASTSQDLFHALKNISDAVTPLAPVSLALAGGLAAIIAAAPPGVITALAGAWLAVSVGLRLSAAMMTLFDIAAAANPIGLIVLAVAGLAGAFYLAYKKGTVVKTLLGVMWQPLIDTAKVAYQKVKDVQTAIERLVGKVLHIGISTDVGAKARLIATTIGGLAGKVLHIGVSTNVGAVVSFVKGQLSTLRDKVINVTTIQHAAVGPLGGVFGKLFGGHALGTNNAHPGWKWVGERGPELMRFRGGEQVLPADVSAQVAGSAGGGGSFEVTAPLQLVLPDGKVLHQALLKVKRDKGGVSLGLA